MYARDHLSLAYMAPFDPGRGAQLDIDEDASGNREDHRGETGDDGNYHASGVEPSDVEMTDGADEPDPDPPDHPEISDPDATTQTADSQSATGDDAANEQVPEPTGAQVI